MSKADVINEIHKQARVRFKRRTVVMKDIDDLWQADLIDMQMYSKLNNGYNYILVVIDTFSKFTWTYPLKQKNKEQVTKAFEKIVELGRIPLNLQTDRGTEFYNEKFKHLMKKYKINHYSTFSTKKASIAERVIRTLKNKLFKQFSLQGNYRWIDGVLHKIVQEYNHTFHRTIACMPADVNECTKKNVLRRYNKLLHSNTAKSKKNRFTVGDYVRISKYKGSFGKGYTPNWSTEIFKIIKAQNTCPTTYLLQDANYQPILGAFYEEELQKTKYPNIYLVEKVIKKKGNKVFVKWLGLPDSENSWIDRSNHIK